MFFFCGSVATGGGNGFASWSCSQLYPGTKASLVLLDCQAPGRSVATFQASLTPHSPVKDLSKFSRLEKTHKKETFISHRRVICWCFWSSMRFMFQVFFFPASLLDWAMIKHVEAFNQDLLASFGGTAFLTTSDGLGIDGIGTRYLTQATGPPLSCKKPASCSLNWYLVFFFVGKKTVCLVVFVDTYPPGN